MNGIQVSRKYHNADTKEPTELSFSSRYYMHTIAQTAFCVANTGANFDVSHTIGYLPIVLGYLEDINNPGQYQMGYSFEPGANKTVIHIGNGSASYPDRVRYYALYQNL